MADRAVGSAASARSQVHRYPHRAVYERSVINAILDEGIVCHVGLATDKGHPVVIPLAYGRSGDTLYLHGSAASRLFRGSRREGVEICATVTIVDGIVVARSTYNTDLNYRSVVVIGKAVEVTDEEEKRAGLDALVDHILPGRSSQARPPTVSELRSTMLLALPLDESSAKVRTGWTNDDEEDHALEIWAGVVPLRTVADPAMPDPGLAFELSPPESVTPYVR
jgi:nitroimidazol reductase NimA-like FMN-containing flavoprotein (pyridoxamine 5'-phosphate oxidase superfamily)